MTEDNVDQEKRKRQKSIFFGWYTVLTGFVLSVIGYGLWFYGMSALFKPISEEFGYSRTEQSLISKQGRQLQICLLQ